MLAKSCQIPKKGRFASRVPHETVAEPVPLQPLASAEISGQLADFGIKFLLRLII
jgi:hypothetical protein